MSKKMILIGGTAAGLSAASKAKRCNPELEITVFEKSGYVSYGACGLPYFVGGLIKEPEDLVSLSVTQLKEKRGIPTYIHHEVTQIAPDARTVTVKNLDTGALDIHHYDYLVIATGAVPILPELPGIHSDGVCCLRTVEDGVAIKARVADGTKNAVIVGGGFIGLELAEELTLAGVAVTLVEAMPRLLPFLPTQYSALLQDEVTGGGVTLHTGVTVTEVLSYRGRATAVMLSDGSELGTGLVIWSAGVRPNSALGQQCGLRLGERGGIVVDKEQRTSAPGIWACGDCVEMQHLLTDKPCYIPLGTTANKQGRIAGGNICGEAASFPGVLGSQVTKVFNMYIASTGLTLQQASDAGYDAIASSITKGDKASYYPGGGDNHITLVFQRVGGRLLGAQAVGSETVAGRMNVLVAAITMGMTVSQLNNLDLVYSPSVAPVYDPLLIAAAQALKKTK